MRARYLRELASASEWARNRQSIRAGRCPRATFTGRLTPQAHTLRINRPTVLRKQTHTGRGPAQKQSSFQPS